MIQLTPRLELAASLCRGAGAVADVGCDHAHLSIALLQRGWAQSAVASDLREGPLARARENIALWGLSGRIRTVLCDGLQGITPDACDTVVICGMGGENICAILDAAPWCMDGAHRLVLQPMTRASVLRRYLAEHGCGTQREALAEEGRKLYSVLLARGNLPVSGREQEFLFTDSMRDDPHFPAYMAMLREKYRVIAEGRRASGLPDHDAERLLALLRNEITGG